MTDSQFHQIILAELKESNRLMKAMVSELSQIKFELMNERLRREREKEMRIKEAEQRPIPPAFSYTIPIPAPGPSEYHPKVSKEYEHAVDVMK